MYKLHAFAQSGNAYKVAVLLQALRQPWTAVHMPFADFASGVPRSDAFRQGVNAMGEIPIIEVGDRKLTQSRPSCCTCPTSRRIHITIRRRAAECALDVLRQSQVHQLLVWRFTKAFAPVAPDPAIEKWLRGRIDNAFGIVERHLANREYVVGTQPSIADMSLCGYVYYPPEESGYDLAKQYPAITRWAERLKQLPGWKPPYELLPGERVQPRW
jgi:glutathione S-transferase